MNRSTMLLLLALASPASPAMAENDTYILNPDANASAGIQVVIENPCGKWPINGECPQPFADQTGASASAIKETPSLIGVIASPNTFTDCVTNPADPSCMKNVYLGFQAAIETPCPPDQVCVQDYAIEKLRGEWTDKLPEQFGLGKP